ncbi:phenylalanine--tRNA ligase subunit beta [Desulfococcus sp.]|uniref:phenylalanine--tRNA ligase subunit beta n=1 Tax=Desulfococcus sp. TaxID=2025834 RepID=UPI0035936A7A
MKVSLSWLREYIPVDMDVVELAERLTMAGLEVDSVEDRYAWLNTVRVGRVLSVDPHPRADKLKLCRVDAGDRTVQVVCGAPNVAPGMTAPLALPGTVFPGGKLLEKGMIRGEASEGMLCSEAELELGIDAGGIMTLNDRQEAPAVGAPLPEALRLSDASLEIDLTPNRPDCLSVMGVAREIGFFQHRKITRPEIRLPRGEGDIRERTSVAIAAPEHCPRYAARLIEGIQVRPSPFWLQDRLLSVGLRPINNIVDITNFVMMETGQPLHAFDFDQLSGHRIVVRTAAEGETFTTLDGKERALTDAMLMICDGERPVAVGGVMGGLNSEIEAGTTRVLIESAYFSPTSIRRTAKTLGLGTDASHRFERGVDPEGTVAALDRAAQLMLETGGGTLISGVIDERPIRVGNAAIDLSIQALNRHLGTGLSRDAVAGMLGAIEFTATPLSEDLLRVLPPSFRVDIFRPEDLMEEVARLSGYNSIPVTFPRLPAEGVQFDPRIVLRNRVKDLMVACGFAEAINYSFVDEASCDKLRLKPDDQRRRLLHILNPLTEEQSVMRTSLVPGLLAGVSRNLSQQNRDLKLFEVGMSFLSNGQDRLPDEVEIAAGVWTGARSKASWFTLEAACDFYDLKGVVESLLSGLGVSDVRVTAAEDHACDYTRPGHTAVIDAGGVRLGILGELHPEAMKNFGLRQTAFIFELNLDLLRPLFSETKQARPMPKFPPTDRDITLIVDRPVEAGAVVAAVLAAREPLVEEAFLFDVYDGEKMPEGKKSVSIRIVYRSPSETLEDEVVSPVHEKISAVLMRTFHATFPA